MQEEIEAKVRKAVAAGSFGEANLLLSSYCNGLQMELQNSSPAAAAEKFAHVNDLFEWMFRMVSAARAHDTAQLTQMARQMASVSPYRYLGPAGVTTWQVEG